MFGWKSKKIPKYTVETTDQQLRHIRTHMAAQAGQISSLLTVASQTAGHMQEIRVDQAEALQFMKEAIELEKSAQQLLAEKARS